MSKRILSSPPFLHVVLHEPEIPAPHVGEVYTTMRQIANPKRPECMADPRGERARVEAGVVAELG